MEATTYAPGKGEWRRALDQCNGSARVFDGPEQLPEQANSEVFDALDRLQREIEGVSISAVHTQRSYPFLNFCLVIRSRFRLFEFRVSAETAAHVTACISYRRHS